VGTVQNTIRDLGTRTRAINKTLREVSSDAAQPELPLNGVGDGLRFEALVPALAAAAEDE
jgi:hypothetical protein